MLPSLTCLDFTARSSLPNIVAPVLKKLTCYCDLKSVFPKLLHFPRLELLDLQSSCWYDGDNVEDADEARRLLLECLQSQCLPELRHLDINFELPVPVETLLALTTCQKLEYLSITLYGCFDKDNWFQRGLRGKQQQLSPTFCLGKMLRHNQQLTFLDVHQWMPSEDVHDVNPKLSGILDEIYKVWSKEDMDVQPIAGCKLEHLALFSDDFSVLDGATLPNLATLYIQHSCESSLCTLDLSWSFGLQRLERFPRLNKFMIM